MQLVELSERTGEKKRRTAAEMLELKCEFEKTKLTVHGFSRLHRVSSGILYRWKRQGQSKETKISGFARVEVSKSAPVENSLFAEVRGIRIYQQVSASFLKELLA